MEAPLSTTQQALPLPPTAQRDTSSDTWVGIIDDDVSIRRALARVFRSGGIRAETFGSAEEYLCRGAHGEPGCLVLDVHLGMSSGLELQDRLLAEGKAPPIILMTGHDWIPSPRLTRGDSVSGYLRKPFDPNVLIALVRRHLDHEQGQGQ
jgi:FixJ family two-component response regulator